MSDTIHETKDIFEFVDENGKDHPEPDARSKEEVAVIEAKQFFQRRNLQLPFSAGQMS